MGQKLLRWGRRGSRVCRAAWPSPKISFARLSSASANCHVSDPLPQHCMALDMIDADDLSVQQSCVTAALGAGGTDEGKSNKFSMFHDENMSFFRRLAWSPEGAPYTIARSLQSCPFLDINI